MVHISLLARVVLLVLFERMVEAVADMVVPLVAAGLMIGTVRNLNKQNILRHSLMTSSGR